MFDPTCDRCGDDLPLGHPDREPGWNIPELGGGTAVCARCLTDTERDHSRAFDITDDAPDDYTPDDAPADIAAEWNRSATG